MKRTDLDSRVVQLRRASSIEEEAHQMRLSVWNNRYGLLSGDDANDPIKLLEPALALHLLGFNVGTSEDLGEMFDEGRRVRVAGLINRDTQTVSISSFLEPKQRRFTSGHELAHAILHPEQTVMHRDRAITEPQAMRSQAESEADRFSSAYLMPVRLLLREFSFRFGSHPFRFDEGAIFGLGIKDLGKVRSTRDVAYVLANATMFMGRPFRSLAQHFQVSPTAMAIRLGELDLVEDFSSARMW